MMSEKLKQVLKFNNIVQRKLNSEKLFQRTLTQNQRENVDKLTAKYNEVTSNIGVLKERIKTDNLYKVVKDAVSKYEQFTGVAEVMALQNSVVKCQEQFMAAQEERRELGRTLSNIELELKEIHAEMQTTMKGDDKYLKLCNEEHKLILQERTLQQRFSDAEREEREMFAAMSSAVKLSHERERAHAERNKYWYIVASITGTLIGIAGSTVNNRMKMAEFKELMEEQMARSAGVLYSVAGGATGNSRTSESIAEAMKTEFAYQIRGTLASIVDLKKIQMNNSVNPQEQLVSYMKAMQETLATLVNKQSSLIDHIRFQEKQLESQLREIRKLIVAAAQSSAKSDAELAKVLASVQQEQQEIDRQTLEPEVKEYLEIVKSNVKPSNNIQNNPYMLAGVAACAVLVLGSMFRLF